ncbi:MAG: DUF3027 domain-containing protein [Luteolibacter sp.]
MKNKAEDLLHFQRCHERWIQQANYIAKGWIEFQCHTCAYYVPLTGAFACDWGACTNRNSPEDGRVKFEHDGCDMHELADAPSS